MEKLVEIEGKKIGLKASAGTVCAYRNMFNRDLILDMGQFEEELFKTKVLSMESTAIAENAIWMMAKEYDSDIPDKMEWLSQFSPLFVYKACASVIMMWHENMKQLNKSKKK